MNIPPVKPRMLVLPAAAAVAAFFAPPSAFSQSAPAPGAAESAPTKDQVVQMSAFEVNTTQGVGYVASNAARGFKTNESLMEIPQADIVMTSDMIKDTGGIHSADILRWIGVVSQYQGEVFCIRGSRASAWFINDMPDYGQGYEDNVDVDSYDVLKGPTAVLYPNASLTGTVVKSLKKPLAYEQGNITETVDQFGFNRTTVDYNKPMGKIGNTDFIFRFVGAYQNGHFYFQNKKDDRIVIIPNLGIHYKEATINLSYHFERDNITENDLGILTPDGNLWTGWGRDFIGLPPGGDTVENEHIFTRLEYLQKISDQWENRFQGMYAKLRFYGTNILPAGNVNFVNYTETFHPTLYNLPGNEWVAMDDVTGKMELGPIHSVTTFGFITVNNTSISKAWSSAPFGTNGVATVSILSPAAINAFVVPPISAYTVPANPGTRSKALYDNIYWQQEFGVIPGWLSVVAGYTFANIETITDTNIAVNTPYASTDLPASRFLHRFGGILHLGKEAVLYVLNSTTFSPPVGVDYNNNRLTPVAGQGTEVGLKTAFLNGRISSTLSIYHMALTNQAIIGVGTNVAGVGYYQPIGSTTQKGVDGDVAIALGAGFQMIFTGYVGTVSNQTGSTHISATYDNSWSLFTRYDFGAGDMASDNFLKGLAVGGGVSRVGSYWLSTSAETVPAGTLYQNPAKMKEGTPIELFVEERFGKHWLAHVSVQNLLDQTWPLSGQTPYTIDPSPVRTFSLAVTYKF